MRKIYFLLSSVLLFLAATQKLSAQYCGVTFPSNVEPITFVNFNTISNATDPALNGTPALEDFTAITTAVFKTTSYPITVKGNTDGTFTNYIDVYIDWNHDNDFGDPGENFFIGTIFNSTGLDAIEASGNILVPPTALDGSTRMRVIKKWNASAGPCNAAGYGQAEDYTLIVGTLPPCVNPLGGGTPTGPAGAVCPGSNFTMFIAGGSFGTGITYQWESSPDNATWIPVDAATSASLTTSANASTYYRRKISCSGSDAYSTSILITVNPPLALPFTEDFATYVTNFPPTCWTRNSATALLGVAQSAFGIGNGSAKFDFYYNFGDIELTTATFTAVPANHRLTFDHAYATYFFDDNDQLEILYSIDGGATYTTLILYDGGNTGPLNTAGISGPAFTPTADQWATKSITLPVGTNKLLFRGISAFGNNLFIDNITVEPIPPCLAPTGLTTAFMTPTTADLSWTASASNPSNGYQWEVRTSGAAGSGATGLVANGVTIAGVTTVTVNSLTASTTYSSYVRSDCGGGTFSAWTLVYVFTTPCNPVATPITENFATYATIFPPTCWTRNNASLVAGDAASAYAIGTGSVLFDFYTASAGTNLDLVSPLFTPVPANHRLVFDHAYATYFFDDNDQLQIFYSTDGGATYISLITYDGGTNGPLNTGGISGGAFTPGASQWDEKAIDLPVGTNRIRFRGISAYGNNLYLDNISIQQTPSCLAPTGLVTAIGVSPTTVLLSYNSPGTDFVVEYGAPGFTPGTTNTAGVGGTAVTVTGATSPITITGLTASTTYDFYIRRVCIAGVDYSLNKKATATTLCPPTNIPYLQTFESAVVPAMPTCTSTQDVNGNSGSFWFGTGAGSWETYTDANPLTYVSPSKALLYYYDFNDLSRPADDWFYTQGLNLTAGTSYRLKFYYKGLDGVNYPEKLEVKYGTTAYAPNMTTGTLFTNNNISSVYGQAKFDSAEVDFTPPATGLYYLGFHAMSDADELGLLVDDISVKTTPLVDVGITGLTLPSLNCPTNGVIVQATIRNYNLTAINFATYPVTVTANITGAATATLSAVLNAGTLAAGASMSVYLNPAFNFSAAGTYSITTTATSPDDGEPGNNVFITSVNVNPIPAAPVITPASPQLCIGGQVQLNTQFAASPPPVTLPAVSSGTIAVVVPGSPGTHTLAVNSVPVGATVTGISVTMNMTHPWISDMVINLRAPNGNVLNLFNSRGGDGDNLVNTVISSASTAFLSTTGAPPFTGTFTADGAYGIGPAGNVSNVFGFPDLYSVGNGNWTLAMQDIFPPADDGTLTSWSITITYQIVTPVITWTPVTGLFTNATATTAYVAGTNAYSVYSKPPATGTYGYTVTATTSAGCTASGTATVTVNAPTPVTIGNIPDTVCISDQVIPLAASPGGGSWSGIGVSGTSFIPPATAVGTYTLTYSYTNSFGCASTATKRIAVKDCPERIILLRDNAVILYPNPNNGLFNIRINSVLYNNLVMKVYTNNGVLVRTQQLSGLAYSRVVPIDLTNLPGGVYMVHFYYEGGVRTSEKTFRVIIGHK